VAITFHNESIRFDLKEKIKHKKWIRHFIESNNRVTGDLVFVFTSNEQLKLMNLEYLNHNYFTDVITFDYTEGKITSGDVFISIDQVRENAALYQVEPAEELRRVMIHGVLHLMGYKDGTEEERLAMREKENDALHLWLKQV